MDYGLLFFCWGFVCTWLVSESLVGVMVLVLVVVGMEVGMGGRR